MRELNHPIFEPSISYAAPSDPVWKRAIIRCIEQFTGQPEMERKYKSIRIQDTFAPEFFWRDALHMLNITLDYDACCIKNIPKTGPLVIIANHPFGVLDGLSICHLATLIRPNFQILTNSVLCQDPALAPYLLPVDFDETREAMRTNIETKNRAIKTMEADGAVVIFPGGGISTAEGWRGQITDLEWKRFAAKLIQISKATVVPLFFHGQNSRLFHIVSQFSLTLRLSLLLWEAKRRANTSIKVTIGAPLPYPSIAHLKDRQRMLDFLRAHVYGLAET
ncbi:MAG: lysophospholipid acyltransferase family protein [Rhodothermales bacterium]